MSYSESNSSIEDYESYVKFINSLNDGFELLETRLDNNGNIIDYVFLNVNPAYERQTGLRASNILGRRKKEVAPAAEQRWYDYALQALETGRIQSYQYFNPNVNRYFETQFIPIPPGKIAVLFKDITERKQAEEALVQSQKNFKNIVKQSPIAFSLFDEKGFLVQVNSAWDEQWQIPHQLVLGKFNILESEQIIDGGFIPDIRRVYAGMTIKNYELEFDASTVPLTQGYGRKRCLAATAYPIKNESGEVSIVVLTEDITERKKNELALKETEEKFEDLFEQSPSVFEIYNNEGLLIRANKAWEKLWQLPRDITVGKWNVLKSEQTATTGIQPFVKRAYAGEIVFAPETEFDASLEPETHGKGAKRLLNTVIYPIKDERGLVTNIVVMHEDITERKQLKESERKYIELYDSFDEAFIATDWEFNVIHWNKAAERITRISPRDALGKKLYDVTPEMLSVNINPYLEALKQRKSVKFMVNTVSRETNQEATFEISTYPSDTGIIYIIVDKTEDERTKRLSTIGQVAGMVGHDIRNPLQAMISDVYLMKEEINTTPDCKSKEGLTESIVSLEENISYVNKIVQDLQDYTRSITPEYSTVDLSNVLVRLFETIRVPESIKLSIKVKDLEKLRTDPMLLQRALTNLVTNAIQAMPEGGTLELKSAKQADKVIITVSDTGVGISDELKSKLFTPMMTTKAKGQGFGLAVSKRLIEEMKGTINFESEKGKGTKFTIELPINQ